MGEADTQLQVFLEAQGVVGAEEAPGPAWGVLECFLEGVR